MIRILCLTVLASLLTPTAYADTEGDCLKRVFNQYCLGGPASSLADPVDRQTTETGLDILTFETAQRPVKVTVRKGRIVAVGRQEAPGTWLNFTDWRAKLVRLYRSGEDLSTLPRYATARNSRLNAIRAGKGRAHLRWPQDGWWVELIWDNTAFVLLNYELAPEAEPAPEQDLGL